MSKLKSSEKGIGLVETVVALGVAVIVITSLVSLSVYTLRTSNRGKLYLQGSKQANEGLELVRAYRDSKSDWGEFINSVAQGSTNCHSANGCHITSSLTVASGSARNTMGTPSQADDILWDFRVFAPNGTGPPATSDNVVRVMVRSWWSVGGEETDAYVYTDLSNWRSN